jgi:putative membrane protein
LNVRRTFRQLALGLFCVYLAVLPGSTITVMLDRIPAWGTWMGGALLMLQGVLLLCWLIGNYGRRGALVALLVFLLAWLVEQIGVSTGAPFGRYRYTSTLQPQLLGIVPLAIPCAWLMVALGAWQLAARQLRRVGAPMILVAATLLMLLDVQIETVATAINPYWVWIDSGRYYGVPLSNFVAWWLVGGLIALIVARGLSHERSSADRFHHQDTKITKALCLGDRTVALCAPSCTRASAVGLRAAALQRVLPSCLYILNSLMFTAINLARGYVVAGLIGLALLLALTLSALRRRDRLAATAAARQTAD